MLQTKRGGDMVGKYADGSTVIVPNNTKKMEKGLKIWQALVSLILLIITVGTMVVNLSNKVETLRVKNEFFESSLRDFNLLIKDKTISDNQRFDKIQDQLTQILIQLQEKENRK
ncbi:MAG TPA: hypothetical protein VFD60_00825 [Nitrososphaeraceae archaeon]|nr:hypothetical protein [Nitrososphaeraceae archaeon]